jgi:hypothetical protein
MVHAGRRHIDDDLALVRYRVREVPETGGGVSNSVTTAALIDHHLDCERGRRGNPWSSRRRPISLRL